MLQGKNKVVPKSKVVIDLDFINFLLLQLFVYSGLFYISINVHCVLIMTTVFFLFSYQIVRTVAFTRK